MMMIPLKARWGQRCRTAAMCTALFAAGASAASVATAADFGRKDGPPQALLDELLGIVDRAARERRADRDFLAELRDFIDTYDQPWTQTVLDEHFADGDYTRSPTWTVSSGQFQVDRRRGLYARSVAASSSNSGGNKRKVGEELAAALLGQLLQGGNRNTGGSSSQRRPGAVARISTPVRTGNAFAVAVDLSGISAGTTLQIGLHSAPGSREGYRLVADSQGEVQLVRLSARGTAIIDRAQASLSAGRAHELNWTRGRTGRMRVELNGRTVLDTRDRAFEGGFAALSLSAEDGELAVRRVSVHSAAK